MPPFTKKLQNPDYKERAERFMKRLELLEKEEQIKLEPKLRHSQDGILPVLAVTDQKPTPTQPVPPPPNVPERAAARTLKGPEKKEE